MRNAYLNLLRRKFADLSFRLLTDPSVQADYDAARAALNLAVSL